MSAGIDPADARRVISFRLQYSFDDPRGERWPLVPLAVGPDIVLEMLPNLLSPRSSVSRQVLDDRRWRGMISGHEPPFLLPDLRIVGQSVPSVAVRVGTSVRLLGADGMLGFDFFGQFERVVLEPLTLRGTLVRS